MSRWLEDVIEQAVTDPEHDVRLVAAERQGFDFEVDGVRIFGEQAGMPWEYLTVDLDDMGFYLSEESNELVDSILDERREETQQRYRERMTKQTANHRDVEGIGPLAEVVD